MNSAISATPAVARVLHALGAAGKVRRTGTGWEACCPAHSDSKPSLSISVGDQGGAVLHCHAGCGVDAVLLPLKLKPSDLFAEKTPAAARPTDSTIVYSYVDEQGAELFQVVRKPGKKFLQRHRVPGAPNDWIWNLKGVRHLVLFHLPEVMAAARDEQTIYVVEGEKDALALEKLGLIATCNAGGAGKWRDEHSEQLRGAREVVVVADRDEPGRKHAQAVASSLSGRVEAVRIVEVPVGKDASDWIAAGATREDFEKLASGVAHCPTPSLSAAKPDESLDDVLDRFLREVSVPEFPADALGPVIGSFIRAVAEALQVPLGLIGPVALAVCAAAVMKKVKVAMAPDHLEPVQLWVMAVGSSGSRKSAVIDAAKAPLVDWEGHQFELHGVAVEVANAKRSALQKRVERFTKEFAEADSPDDRQEAEEALSAATRDLAEFKAEVVPRLLTADATVEGLGRIMAAHGNRMAIFSAEARKLLTNMGGRYTGGKPDFDLYLQGHAGDTYITDRVLLAGRPLRLKEPALTICTMAQRSVLPKLRDLDDGSGLFPRFLISAPDGSDAADENFEPAAIPESAKTAYHSLVNELLTLEAGVWPDGSCKEYLLRPSPEALATYLVFRRSVALKRSERLNGEYSRDERLSEWAAKFHGVAARIAGILHLVSWGGRSEGLRAEISADSMKRAIRISEYFAAHELRAVDLSTDSAVLTHVRNIVRFAVRTGRFTFSERDLVHSGPPPRGDAKLRIEALRLLVLMGLANDVTPEKSKNHTFQLDNKVLAMAAAPRSSRKPGGVVAGLSQDRATAKRAGPEPGYADPGRPVAASQRSPKADVFRPGHQGGTP